MKFGIAFEGLTDYVVLENILCGYFDELETDDIQDLQPKLDETDTKQLDFGGWEKLLDYLSSTYFRDTLLSLDYVIIQIDTDISERKHFGVSHYDVNHQARSVNQLVDAVKNRLIEFINKNDAGFYEYYADRIIFAICVHSLECWLYAYHNTKPLKKPKITSCGKALNYLFNESGFDDNKDKKLYREYSKAFSKYKNLERLAKKDLSFGLFIEQLANIVI